MILLPISSDELEPSKLLPHPIIFRKKYLTKLNKRGIKFLRFNLNDLKDELCKLLKKKLIEPSHSPWASPFCFSFFLKKKKR